jgi:hypothetical protein
MIHLEPVEMIHLEPVEMIHLEPVERPPTKTITETTFLYFPPPHRGGDRGGLHNFLQRYVFFLEKVIVKPKKLTNFAAAYEKSRVKSLQKALAS